MNKLPSLNHKIKSNNKFKSLKKLRRKRMSSSIIFKSQSINKRPKNNKVNKIKLTKKFKKNSQIHNWYHWTKRIKMKSKTHKISLHGTFQTRNSPNFSFHNQLKNLLYIMVIHKWLTFRLVHYHTCSRAEMY